MKTLLPLMIVALLLAACGSKEDNRDSFYRKAENHYTAGRYDDAVLELKNALRIDPKFAQGYMLQGKILLRKGDMRGAYGNFNQAVEVDPELLEARAYLGQIYLAAGQLDKAEEQDQAIQAKDPSLGRGILLRAGILGRKKQSGQAMVMLRDLLAKEPENDEAYLLLGLLHKEAGDPAGAVETLAKGSERLPANKSLRLTLANLLVDQGDLARAESLFRAFIAEEPSSASYNLMLVKFFLQTGQEAKAASHLESLVTAEPGRDEYWLGLTQIQLNRGEADKAKETLKRGVAAQGSGYGLRIALARLLVQEDNRPGAMSLLRETVDLDPLNAQAVPARQMIAELLFEEGKADEALSELNIVFERNPGDLAGHFLKGRILLVGNKPQEAIQEFRQVIKDQPEMLAAGGFLAQAHFMNNQPDLAVDVLLGVLKQDPGYVPARQVLAEHYRRHGQWDKAVAELEEIVQRHPERLEVHLAIGDVNMARKQTSRARESYERALADPRTAPAARVKLARLALAEKDPRRGLEQFEEALALAPEYPEAMEGKALALVLLDKANEALAYTKELRSKHPDNPFVHDLAGRMALAMAKDEQAEAGFLRAIELSPNWLPPYYRLATLYVSSGRVEQGIAQFEKDAARQPDQPHTSFLLALLHQQKGDATQAEKRYAALLEKHPDFLPAANNLAYLYAESSKDPAVLQKALELATRAAQGDDPVGLDTLGWVHFRMGNTEMAAEALSKALEKSPDNPTIAYHLATVLARNGDKLRARELLEKALASGSSFRERGDAEALLATM